MPPFPSWLGWGRRREIAAVLKARIVKLPSPNFTLQPKGHRVSMIVLHATVGGFASAVDWLRKGDRDDRTSAHYVVAKDGGVVQLVDENDASWHAGFGKWKGDGKINNRSIGIELENANDGEDAYPIEQLESTMWLCVRCCRSDSIAPEDVVGHCHVDPKRKTDPVGFPWEDFRASLKRHLKQG